VQAALYAGDEPELLAVAKHRLGLAAHHRPRPPQPRSPPPRRGRTTRPPLPRRTA
jgi:hypothetical protein